MAEKSAPPFEQARCILDEHFNRTFDILTVRQLKAACGGSGSLSTYSEYRERWRQDRVSRSGVISTFLALQNQIDAFTKTLNNTVDNLRSQFKGVPLSMPDDEMLPEADRTKALGEASLADESEEPIRTTEVVPNEADESECERLRRLAEIAAAKSEPRFLDEPPAKGAVVGGPKANHERASPSNRSEHKALEKEGDPLSRADTSGHQATLPLGATQSRRDERGTMNDGGAS